MVRVAFPLDRLAGLPLAWKEGRTSACVALMVAVWLLWAMVGVAIADSPRGFRARVAADVADRVARGERSQLILPGSPDAVQALIERHGLQVERRLRSGAVVSVDQATMASLSADPAVSALAADRPVYSTMSVTTEATGAQQVWAGLEQVGRYTGRGIGIAMIDSGLTETGPLRGRVAVHVDFVDGARGAGRDFYGHGTHIAGIMAGNSGVPGGFRGMAPGAHIINLRVLAADGSGQSSDVIEAIDWTIENKARYGIRVLNVSLGHPAIEAAADDPLVQAVERAVRAGIVVVCSAGNLGKHPVTGQPIIGAINSPGNSPSVITVGALNTKGTPQRSDDEVASYSSRGPTYGDGFVKPDLVAPGNRIVSLAAPVVEAVARTPRAAPRARLHRAERHQPGGRGRRRRRRPRPRREPEPEPASGEAGAAGHGVLHAAGRRRRRGGRQPERRRRGPHGQARTGRARSRRCASAGRASRAEASLSRAS